MKKTYMKPEMTQEPIFELHIMAASGGGVDSGNAPGDEYNPEDISYSNQMNHLWDEDSND